MLIKNYQIVKVVVIAAFAALLAVVLSLENNDPRNSMDGRSKVRNFDIAADFVLWDPYNAGVLRKVEKNRKETRDFFLSQYDTMTNMMTDRKFVEEVFAYLVSQKISGMESLVRKYFGTNAAFRDMIIIDTNNSVLYKYSSGSIIAEFMRFPTPVRSRIYNDKVGIVNKYREDNFDIDLEIIFLFDSAYLEKMLKSMDFPAYLSVDNQFIRNTNYQPYILGNNPTIVSNSARIIDGFKIFESCPIIIQRSFVGSLVQVYPTRSVASILLSILKVAFLIALVAGLFLLDRRLSGRSRAKDTSRLQMPASGARRKAGSTETGEKQLNWIEDYIQETEEKNEKKP